MDPVLDKQLVYDAAGQKLHARLVMSTNIRTAILERNSELKKNVGVINDMEHGRLMLSIPELDYWHIRKRRPEMFEGDAATRSKALAKFLASPESAPYKIR